MQQKCELTGGLTFVFTTEQISLWSHAEDVSNIVMYSNNDLWDPLFLPVMLRMNITACQ